MSNENRTVWGSKFGFLMAAIGSAVGLGNVWRFSYIAYDNGGATFLVPYITAIIIAGIPLMILEYAFGHKERGSSPLSFHNANPKMEFLGWLMPTLATFGIMLFYSIVMAWCIRYFMFSFNLSWGDNTQSFFFNSFLNVSDSPFQFGGINIDIFLASLFVWFSCWIICYREVNKGIEKACSIFMPLLFILTAILVAWSLTLDGAMIGLRKYLFDFDINKLNTKAWTDAFGQIFFTLSLGFGIMITYASYLPKKTNIVKSAYITTICNCCYSVFAGIAVFATLGFMANAKGVDISEVVKGGPALAFIVYPEAVNQLPFGQAAFGAIFFFSLIIAGLSSGVSLLEAFVCSFTDKFNVSRGKVVTIVCTIGFLGSIIFTTNAGIYIVDICDHFINHYGILVGGLLECILIGWVIKAKVIQNHVNSLGETKLANYWNFIIRFVTPAILLIILFIALYKDITKPYEGYSIAALVSFGLLPLAFCILMAIIFTILPWKKSSKQHAEHEDKIFDL
ncbi:MAG: sodium-dependent transporter [Lentisphaeria bacterium]